MFDQEPTADRVRLKAQACLLEQTLQHSKQSISDPDPAVVLWYSTYGERTELDYPNTLLPILDGLWINGRICLGNVRGMCGVSTTTRNRTLKRVELVEPEPEPSKELGHGGSFVRGKWKQKHMRKWSKLTKHQKEVRRAQQGRATACEDHGPRFRTYTILDSLRGTKILSRRMRMRASNRKKNQTRSFILRPINAFQNGKT